MSHEEMLRHLGLTDQELKDLLQKFNRFYGELNKDQQATVTRSLPALDEAARTFGPDVNAPDLDTLLKTHAPDDASVGVAVFEGINPIRNSGS